MRIRIFFICLFFILLGGLHNFYAGTIHRSTSYCSIQNLTKKCQITITNEDHSVVIIEDIDVEEEFQGGRDIKDDKENKFFAGKYTLLNTLYSEHYRQFILNNYDKYFKIFLPLSGKSCPIYITQRVLRI